MIQTRKEQKFYINEDRKRNAIPQNWGRYVLRLLAGQENAAAFRYIKCMRYLEYHLNNSNRNCIHKLLFIYYKLKNSRMGLKYNLYIRPNTCGYGLRIMHLTGGGGVHLNIEKAGNYCGFNAGVLLGNKDTDDNRPTLGDHVAFGPGAKAFGKINIGNNVFVAPNAVVSKDVPADCVVGGVPAKIIKYKEKNV